jgi:hypothetical protein
LTSVVWRVRIQPSGLVVTGSTTSGACPAPVGVVMSRRGACSLPVATEIVVVAGAPDGA